MLSFGLCTILLGPLSERFGKSRIVLRAFNGAFAAGIFPVTTALTILLVGFAVFGTFTYTGAHLKELFDLDVWVIGLVLTSFGVGTVVGGRIAPTVRTRLGAAFLPVAATGGIVALPVFGLIASPVVSVLALFIFGVSFIFLQSTLVILAIVSLRTTTPNESKRY